LQQVFSGVEASVVETTQKELIFMLRRSLLLLTVAGVLVMPRPVRAADSTLPTLILKVRSIDGVMEDVKYLADLVGHSGEAKQVDAGLKQKLPKGFQGVNTHRPLGLYGTIDESLGDSTGVVLIPISNEKDFLELVEQVSHTKPKKDDDGTYELTPDNLPVPVYFRFAHEYAYITGRNKTPLEKTKLLPPESVFGSGFNDTIAATFNLDRIPDALKQIALGQLEVRLADIEQQKPAGDNPEEKIRAQGAKVGAKAAASAITSLLNEGLAFSVRLNIDRRDKVLVAEASLTGKPESRLATALATFARSQSLFAGLLDPDAAINFLAHGSLPSELHKAVNSLIQEIGEKGLAQEHDPAKRAEEEKIFKVLMPTLKAGEVDAAASVRGPSASNHYGVVAGVKVQDGVAIEKTLRDLVAKLPEAERSRIQVDADRAGDTNIHRIDAGKNFDKDAREKFGDSPLYLAFRKDAMLVSLGEGGLEAIKQALAGAAAAAPGLEIDVAVARLAPLMGKSHKQDPRQAAQKAFGAAGKDRDRIRITLTGGQGLKLRMEMSSAVLQFMHMLDEQK
jgi:hypothetical protein